MNLVFHQAALGDFVMLLPTLRRLPGPVTLVVPWSHGRVAARLLPEARVLDAELFEFTRLWADGGPSIVSPAIAEAFECADRIVSYIADADSAWHRNAQRLGGVPIHCVKPRPDATWHRPLSDWHARQLHSAGLDLAPETPKTRYGSASPPTAANADETDDEPHRWLIHPGSGGVAKCWPIARFAEIAARLEADGDHVRFVVGPAEIERGIVDKLRDALRDAPSQAHVVPVRELDDLFAAFRDADRFLGNDAGPTHLAAQLGLHTTALFGPTDPRVWSPVGPCVTAVAPPQPTLITWLSIEQLARQLQLN